MEEEHVQVEEQEEEGGNCYLSYLGYLGYLDFNYKVSSRYWVCAEDASSLIWIIPMPR